MLAERCDVHNIIKVCNIDNALISDNGDAHVHHGALVLVHGRDNLVSHQALLPMTLPQCSLIHL